MGARTKRWTGRIKQAAGTLTGNRRLERAGRAERRSAEVEARLARARGTLDQAVGKAAGAVERTLGTRGRRSRRR